MKADETESAFEVTLNLWLFSLPLFLSLSRACELYINLNSKETNVQRFLILILALYCWECDLSITHEVK